ncbi:MAG: nucleoside-diphosphate sugar epimerase/dehydratase [Ruminococcus sp.]|nr:nucleoside-diphosphate sugar epimerase/dehydratase [Ruminococcus sp.]
MKKINYRKLVLALADIVIIALCGLITNLLASIFFSSEYQASLGLLYYISVNVVFCMLVMVSFGAYARQWRFFNLRDYIMCFFALFIGNALAFAMFFLFGKPIGIGFSLAYFILCTAGVLTFRALFRTAFLKTQYSGRIENSAKTLIVGAGAAGQLVLEEIRRARYDMSNPSNDYLPVCFADDDASKLYRNIKGLPVKGTTDDIPQICQSEGIEQIIVAIPSTTPKNRKRILEICSKTECKIKLVPYLSEIYIDGEKPKLMQEVKDINIDDLLGREPITFDKTEIKNFVEGKVCLVTGGGGSIGSELVRQIAKYNPKQIIIVDIYENNAYDIQQELILDYGDKLNLVTLIASVRDYDKMDKIFNEYRPNLVFHAAAHKHVPLMETVPEEAVKNNIFGTFNVATLAEFYKADKFVLISTDRAVNPTNVMGATKRCCEMIIQYKAQYSTTTEFVATRFGNVLGSNGSVIPLFKRQIENNKPLTVTHPDIIRYFMTIPEAVSLVLEAGAMAKGGEIFVLDMGEPVKILTLAENLIRMYGKVPYKDVEIKFTGLRPGEKLYEELLMNEEGLKSTANKKIFIGKQIHINPTELLSQLDHLQSVVETNDSEATVHVLEEIVPTFNHKTNKP